MDTPSKQTPVESFWQAYLATLPNRRPTTAPKVPEAWSFGDSAEMADALGRLVVQGLKTATCSLLWEYEVENEALPQVGELNIILDGQNRPLCLIELIEVTVQPFNEVDAQFAFEEGEGDRSLSCWRSVHWRYFSAIGARIQKPAQENMPLVCQRFRIIG